MMEYTIGRNNTNDLKIDDPEISASHAKIIVEPDFETFTLFDLDSTNGTYVNGRRIVSKKITDKDSFRFATQKMTGTDLFEHLGRYIKERRTDFSKEFNKLLSIESEYRTKKRQITKHYRLLAMLPRVLVTIVVVAAIFLIPNINSELRYPLMIGASIVGTFVSGLGVSEQRKEDKLNDLRAKFQIQFACPKCGTELNAGGRDSKYYLEKRSCPNRKCNATWHKG